MNSKTLNCQTGFILLNKSLKFKECVCYHMPPTATLILLLIYNVLLGNSVMQPFGMRHTYYILLFTV